MNLPSIKLIHHCDMSQRYMIQASYLFVSYQRKTQFKLRVESKNDLPFLPNPLLLGLNHYSKGREICPLPAQAFQTHSGVNQIQMLLALYSLGCKKKVKQPTERKQESIVCKNNSGYGDHLALKRCKTVSLFLEK